MLYFRTKWLQGSVQDVKQLAGRMTVIASLSVLVVLIALRYAANSATLNSVFKTDIPLDLWIYMRGGERVTDGVNLYEGPIFNDLPFTYPPFAGMVFAWVSAIEDTTVTAIWHTTTAACAATVIWLSLRQLNIDVKQPSFVLIIPLLAVFFLLGTEPLHATLFWGQINVVLMLLVCLDFLPVKHRLPGIGVGLAAGIKLTPAFFGILFLIQRRWWAALGSFLTFLVTVGLGFLVVPDAKIFWTDAIFNSSRVGDHFNLGAQSLKSVLVRNLGIDSGAVWLVAVVTAIVLVGTAAWLAVERGSIPVAVGVTGIGACLVSPFTWYHHWVWIVPLGIAMFVAANQAAASFSGGNAVRWQVAGLLSVGALVVVCLPFIAANVAADLMWEWNSQRGFSWMYVPAALVFLVTYILHGFLERRRAKSQLQGSVAQPLGEGAVAAQQ